MDNYVFNTKGWGRMDKKTIVKIEKNFYDIVKELQDVAIVKFANGKMGLLDSKTNQFIWNMDDCNIESNYYGSVIYKSKKVKNKASLYGYDSISIYDVKNHKIKATDYVLDINWHLHNRDTMKLKSPDGKIHLFDLTYNQNITVDGKVYENIVDVPLDDVDYLPLDKYKKYDENNYFVLILNGKKELYIRRPYAKYGNNELLAPIEFNELKNGKRVIFLKKGDKTQFVYKNHPHIMSKLYDDISADECLEDIIYCKDGNKLTAINTDKRDELFTTRSDSVKYIYDVDDRRIFKTQKKGKYGLLSYEFNPAYGKNPVVIKLLPQEYDYISESRDEAIIKKGKKYGLLAPNGFMAVEPKYNSIERKIRGYYNLHTDTGIDFATFGEYNTFKIIIKDVDAVEVGNTGIIYKKDNKFGFISSKKEYMPFIIDPIYDKITHVSGSSYLVEHDNKKGITNFKNLTIPTEYDAITIKKVFGGIISCALFLNLKKGNKCRYAWMSEHADSIDKIHYVGEHEYNSIDFLTDITVCKDDSGIYIYDQHRFGENQLLFTLPANTSVRELTLIDEKKDQLKSSIYEIDGKYYNYVGNTLQAQNTDDKLLYVTTYETDDKIYEVSSHNKEEHDKFCENVDEKENDEAEQYLTMTARNISNKPNTLALKVRIIDK